MLSSDAQGGEIQSSQAQIVQGKKDRGREGK